MYYKDTNNNLHFLDSAEFEYLLPSDCAPITDKQAKILEAKNQAEFEANAPLPVPPTAAELMAQLQALQSQIESLA